MARTTAPTNKKAPKAKSEAPVEKIIPLTGKALQAKIKELSSLSKSETAKGCGYYSVAKDGTVKVNLKQFYDAVLQSKGININIDKKPKADGRGREASYRATVNGNGQILIGAVYTKALNLVPGDEFEIKMGYKHINLKTIDKEAEA
jgi:AbrB-like transcriptional regulator